MFVAQINFITCLVYSATIQKLLTRIRFNLNIHYLNILDNATKNSEFCVNNVGFHWDSHISVKALLWVLYEK